jgi:hypothetical protein
MLMAARACFAPGIAKKWAQGISKYVNTYQDFSTKFINTFFGNAAKKELLRLLLTGNYAHDHAGRSLVEYFLDF